MSKKVSKEFIKDVEKDPSPYVMPKVLKALATVAYPSSEIINKYLGAVARLNNIPYNSGYLKFIEHGR